MSKLLLPLLGVVVIQGFLVTVAASAVPDQLPAFPGAEGYGAVTAGGRGGRVIKVSNLNPRGPGSLQAGTRCLCCRMTRNKVATGESYDG